jgi:hypothetical protein
VNTNKGLPEAGCIAASNADCRSSERCRSAGECRLGKKQCVR